MLFWLKSLRVLIINSTKEGMSAQKERGHQFFWQLWKRRAREERGLQIQESIKQTPQRVQSIWLKLLMTANHHLQMALEAVGFKMGYLWFALHQLEQIKRVRGGGTADVLLRPVWFRT